MPYKPAPMTLGNMRANGVPTLAVPSRCAARHPHLTAHDTSEIDAEVRTVLMELGENV